MDDRLDALFGRYPSSDRARFKKFHTENPEVWRLFKAAALKIKATKRNRYGARRIIEHIRWEMDLKTSGDVFKINDRYIAMYSRLMIYHYPEFDGFFELRVVRSRGTPSAEERRRHREVDEHP